MSEVTGRTLRDDYPDLIDLHRATPRLIVEQNLYGVDIDPRCAQIAPLALWLRAQRAWKDLGFAASERPRIHRTHIVNLDQVKAFRREGKGRMVAELKDGTELPVSRTRAQELRALGA